MLTLHYKKNAHPSRDTSPHHTTPNVLYRLQGTLREQNVPRYFNGGPFYPDPQIDIDELQGLGAVWNKIFA